MSGQGFPPRSFAGRDSCACPDRIGGIENWIFTPPSTCSGAILLGGAFVVFGVRNIGNLDNLTAAMVKKGIRSPGP